MNSCCHPHHENHSEHGDHEHHHGSQKIDWLFLGSLLTVVVSYAAHLFGFLDVFGLPQLSTFTATSFELVNQMWWGLALGLLFVGLLDWIPKEVVMSVLGRKPGLRGVLRAAAAGVLLDLCSHGILLVGMKLYERGASLGQVMAFLIASPWNSLSLTLILWALVGFPWMITILLLSIVIAVISGVLFDWFVGRGTLPQNPHRDDLGEPQPFWPLLQQHVKQTQFNSAFFRNLLQKSFSESEMILRWILFGVVLAGLVRAFVPTEIFQDYFGPSLIGLMLTVLAATIIEVCSEGSTPLAADLLTRAGAPGNAFAFLMTGVSTDYTEILALRETTKSWKISFFLPLVTVPQVLAIAYVLNQLS